jgi:regulator of protease activity HflC (stomatin/prohibitin superfamily)
MTGLAVLAGLLALVAGAWLVGARRSSTIYAPKVGLLYRDGLFERELPPGRHNWFDPLRRTRIVTISLVEQPVQFGEITVLSKDQFSFRLGLAAVMKVTDARAYAEAQSLTDPDSEAQHWPMGLAHPALHSLVASAAVEAAAGWTLEEILADAPALTAAVQSKLAAPISGADVERVLLTSVNLPPETRKMFTDVERAKKEAEAALERARGEQAALRVLANAARLVNDNPALANLRLLQAVESSKGATTIVIGNPAAPLPGLGGTPAGS